MSPIVDTKLPIVVLQPIEHLLIVVVEEKFLVGLDVSLADEEAGVLVAVELDARVTVSHFLSEADGLRMAGRA